jgi:hypothetical protein
MVHVIFFLYLRKKETQFICIRYILYTIIIAGSTQHQGREDELERLFVASCLPHTAYRYYNSREATLWGQHHF